MKNSNFKIQDLLFIFLLLQLGLLAGCSQPVLESPECVDSRDAVKRFYSFHVGNDMTPSAENLGKRKKFLSDALKKKLTENTDSKTDYFTQTADYPKAFRVGKCETAGDDRASFEILLFWRTDEKDSQREIDVEVVRENDNWQISRVSAGK